MFTVILLVVAITLSNSAIVYAATLSAKTLQEFKSVVTEELKVRNPSFVINYTGNTAEIVSKYEKVLEEIYDSDDYLDNSLKAMTYQIKGDYGNVNITLNYTYIASREEELYTNEKVQEIISQIITSAMTTKGKIKAIHQYIVDHLTYDHTLTLRSAYAALTGGVVVCQGYALLLDKMLEVAGIPSIIVTGSIPAGLHAWNIVQVDGKWYHIDSTNNDYCNFMELYMITDSQLAKFQFTWNRTLFPVANTIFVDDSSTGTVDPVTPATPTLAPPPSVPSPTPVINQSESKTITNANKNINSAIKYANESYLKKAQSYIDKLPDNNPEKAILQNELAEATIKISAIIEQKKIDKAMTAVIKAERYTTLAYLSSAQRLVASLVDLDQMAALQKRLDAVAFIVKQKAIDKATSYVVKLEAKPTLSALATAKKYVVALEDGIDKTILLSRIDDVEAGMEQKAIDKATQYVERALEKPTNTYIYAAQRLISQLKDSPDKVDLQARLNALNK
jgi:hypothetical protein